MQKLNPYYIFNVGLLVVIGVYLLELSDLYPTFSFSTIFFLLCVVLLFIILGLIFKQQYRISNYINETEWTKQSYLLGTIFSVLGTLAEGVYSHGYPLLGQYGDDVHFGIPTFHVFLVVYISFIIICIFESFLFVNVKKQKKKLILLIIINLFCLILDLSRSVIVVVALNCLWLALFQRKRKGLNFSFSLKKVTVTLIGVVCLLYLFGIVGNYRSSLQMNNANTTNNNLLDSTLIYNVGEAKENVRNNKYLGPLFWDYIYISSPLANFQNIVNLKKNSDDTTDKKEILTQYIPEVVSDKLFPNYTWKSSIQYQINTILNATTVFFSSYYILGWLGVLFMVIYMSVFPFIYMYLIEKFSPDYYEIAIALLNTAYLLNLFGNMFSFTVTSLLFLFPFLASFKNKIASLRI